ncbi:efflux RND transporter periplasmic adaptor subunit [Oceanibaculum nanhaiense]|jgi:membrane fusion protein, multidrug efflux system|uniref:efflux RND transporter periplasmic adaptor subunit n=1 Tax=Oceanibaculum nanhaiense TaxID=1909734 RepID=UPI000A36AD38|nr:efflux RND transporter periplasmic adaptor subunit [Oceanibaculum nanhaiense]
MKSSIWIAILFAVAATLWIASGQFGDAADAPSGTPRQETQAALPGVQFIVSETQAHRRELTINGHTEAERRVMLRVETDGRIAEIGVEKGKRVAAGEVIARIALDSREAVRAEARALVRQREAEFSASKQLAGKGFRSDTNLAQTQALLDSARAALARIEVDIANTTIRAPFDGVLNDRMVEVGNYVQAGDEVAQIVDTDPMLVVIEVPETHALSLALGDLAEVRFSNGETRTAVIRFIASVANSATRTFRVEAELDNRDGSIRDGLTAAVKLSLDTVPAHFITPAILTLNDAGQLGVKLVDEAGTVAFRPVRIIASETDGVWLAGLPERARLIVVGQEFVAEGQKVEAVRSENFAGAYATGGAPK